MKATVTSQGQSTIPLAIRRKLRLRQGTVLEFDEGADHLRVTRAVDLERMRIVIAAIERGYLRRYFPRLRVLRPR